MASEQKARNENTTDEREVAIEKDRVPKMASHFEALAEKARESDITGGKDTPLETGKEGGHGGKAVGDIGVGGRGRETHEIGSQFESLADKVKDLGGHEGQQKRHGRGGKGLEGDVGSFTVGKFEVKGSEEDTGKAEQQRTHEEGIEREDQKLDQGSKQEEISMSREERQRQRYDQESKQVEERKSTSRDERGDVGGTMQATAEKGSTVKDTALKKGQQGYEAAKETIERAGKTSEEYAEQGTDYAVTKAAEVQNETLPAAQERAASAKDTAADITKKVASYTGEKAVAAKNVAVDTGKTTAGYAGKVAADVKDKAAAAGWTAVHYSAEKAVEGTKAAAKVVKGVAGYAGETAIAAGHVAADLATKPISVVKDVAISTGESLKDYTARKEEESEEYLKAKRSSGQQETGEVQGKEEFDMGKQDIETKFEEKSTISEQEGFGKTEPGGHEGGEMKEGIGAGEMLGAIGETIFEIAQTTKDLVAGPRKEGDRAVEGYESKTKESKTEHQ